MQEGGNKSNRKNWGQSNRGAQCRGAGIRRTAKLGAEQQRGSMQGGGNKSNRKNGKMGARGSIQGGGNKANRKNGGRATEGLNANDPAAKEEGSLAAKSSNRICYGELQSGSM